MGSTQNTRPCTFSARDMLAVCARKIRHSAKALNPECCPKNREEEGKKFRTQVERIEEELGSERRGRDGERREAAAAEVTLARRDAALASLTSEREAACRERDAACKERDAAFRERDAACKERDAAFRERDAACKERDAAMKQVGDAQIVEVARARGELDAARAQVVRTPP
jgi:hypothetical protein